MNHRRNGWGILEVLIILGVIIFLSFYLTKAPKRKETKMVETLKQGGIELEAGQAATPANIQKAVGNKLEDITNQRQERLDKGTDTTD